MITTITRLLKKTEGKIFTFITIGAFMFSQTSCTIYKYTDINHEQLSDSKRFQKNIEKYNLFVHQGDQVYSLEDVELTKDSSIKGKAITYTGKLVFPDSTWSKKEKKSYFKEHKYDIHIYTHNNLNLEANSNITTNKSYPVDNTLLSNSTITVKPNDIKTIYVTAVDSGTSMSVGIMIVLAAVGVLLIAGLIALTSAASAQGSNTSSQGSNSNSGSNQNQGSSGGSGSGSSGS